MEVRVVLIRRTDRLKCVARVAHSVNLATLVMRTLRPTQLYRAITGWTHTHTQTYSETNTHAHMRHMVQHTLLYYTGEIIVDRLNKFCSRGDRSLVLYEDAM